MKILRTVFQTNEFDTQTRLRTDAFGQRLKRITVRGVDATQFSMLEHKLRARLAGAPMIARPNPFGGIDRDAMVLDVYFRERTPIATALARVSLALGFLGIGFVGLAATRCL